MRGRIGALAASALLAGCGSTPGRPARATAAGTLDALFKRPGEHVALLPGDSDFGPGPIRFTFLVVRQNAQPVYRPSVRVWIATARSARPFAKSVAHLEPIGVPGLSGAAAGDVTKIYVVHFRISTPGRYWLAAEPIGGTPIQGISAIDVRATTFSPAIGSQAPRSQTPTLARTGGDLRLLTTRVPPDLALLRYSVAQSLAAHRPFVVVFATPRFCTSRTCGPVVDVLDSVRRQLQGSGVRFIHVEVYRRNVPSLGYNRWMTEWHLRSEPWTFVVGADGRIRAKFEGSVSTGELVAAVRLIRS